MIIEEVKKHIESKTLSQLDMPAFQNVKQIKAVPMHKKSFSAAKGWCWGRDEMDEAGYMVVMNAGERSEIATWLDKETFEETYKRVD